MTFTDRPWAPLQSSSSEGLLDPARQPGWEGRRETGLQRLQEPGPPEDHRAHRPACRGCTQWNRASAEPEKLAGVGGTFAVRNRPALWGCGFCLPHSLAGSRCRCNLSPAHQVIVSCVSSFFSSNQIKPNAPRGLASSAEAKWTLQLSLPVPYSLPGRLGNATTVPTSLWSRERRQGLLNLVHPSFPRPLPQNWFLRS